MISCDWLLAPEAPHCSIPLSLPWHQTSGPKAQRSQSTVTHQCRRLPVANKARIEFLRAAEHHNVSLPQALANLFLFSPLQSAQRGIHGKTGRSSSTTVGGCQFPRCWLHHQLACGRRSISIRFRLPSMAENTRYLISSPLSALGFFREHDVVAETRGSLFGGGSILCILPRILVTMRVVVAIRLTDLHAFPGNCTTYRETKSDR